MKSHLFRLAVCGITLIGAAIAAAGDAAPTKEAGAANINLSGYCSPEKAITTTIRPVAPEQAGLTGYLGVNLTSQNGHLVIAEVQPNSPADKAGLKKGDVLMQMDGRQVGRVDLFRDLIQSHSPGESIHFRYQRDGRDAEVAATLGAVSRPMKFGSVRVTLGAQVTNPKDGDEGTPVEEVTANGPAANAGIKVGDVIVRIDQDILRRAGQVNQMLAEHRPGDIVKLTLRREGKDLEVPVTLAADRSERGGRGFGGGGRGAGGGFGGRGGAGAAGFSGGAPSTPWTKPVYRLAVLGVEFEDIKHNSKISNKDWEDALFSKGTYSKKNATGQEVHGSLNDYFVEQSEGAFHIEGKVFDWVKASKKRGDYVEGSGTSNRGTVPNEAIDKLLEREKDALKDFDGIFIIYAGSSAGTNRGSAYSPHAGSLNRQGKMLPYMISYEGGERMATLRTFCREFAFLLGLPDLAARRDVSGSKGVGAWCMMGGPLDGSPQGMCAWAKEQLGWVKPAVVDPTVKQKIVLGPIGSAPTQCVKVLEKSDGSEYFLLENRTKSGYDSNLPGSGLVIWRVVNNRPELIESHGIEGSAGTRALPELIPYPSKANNSFTPYTTPSSRSAHGGGLPVYITEIQRLADGRITFHIGYDFQ